MKKITKKQLRKIRKGNHAVLMDCLDYLLDTYNEDKWDNGYLSCLQDMAVRGYRLAEYIVEEVDKRGKLGKDCNGEPLAYFEGTDELAQIIEEYFNEALNNGK